MGWTERDHTGRLVVAKVDLLKGVSAGTMGVILEVIKTFPDGSPCTFIKYDVFFRCGVTLRLERLGQAFDFADD
jgi:hypothetical protein